MARTDLQAAGLPRVTVSRLSRPFLRVARAYTWRALTRSLDGVHVRGLDDLARASSEGPLVLAVTHVSHWDPLVLVALEAQLKGPGHALMDAQNLARLPFFGLVGAVPLRRDDHAAALADLDASSELVRRPTERLWIFPQGEQRPAHLRPLGLRPGVLRLLERSGAPLVPVGLTYAYREAPQPAFAMSIGEPVAAERVAAGGLELIERSVAAQLAVIDEWLAAGAPSRERGFIPLVPPRSAGVEDAWSTKLLAALTQ
jgi:1-acyl-sn-glycerol-3-phosphate acyltransferase